MENAMLAKYITNHLLISYFVAAGLQAIFMVFALPTPHSGIGPLVFGAILLFWILPFAAILVTIAQGLIGVWGASFGIFLISFFVMMLITSRWNAVEHRKRA
jgi:hypothetical protein